MNVPGDAAEWVAKGELDFVAARMLSRSRKHGMGDVVCFHCQQCAEKYAKGYGVTGKFSRGRDSGMTLRCREYC